MKIYIAHENPYNAGNPYIYTLMDSISQMHPDIEWGWGNESFWDDAIFSYDIVHFQWPQAFMASDHNVHSMQELRDRIYKLKAKGILIFATCHDLEPHYEQCTKYAKAFEIVYGLSDTIIHLGEFSKILFERKYTNCRHVIIPHHIYDTVYKTFHSREESATKLKLARSKTYILCLGMFRSDDERKLVIECSKKLKGKGIVFLAPAFMEVLKRPHIKFLPTFSRIKQLYYKWRYKILCLGKTWTPVSDEEIPFYYAISSLVFIQRLKILNSGNAILPMLFNKMIVGPDTGNVGPLLKKWNYPTFDINNASSAVAAIEQGLNLVESQKGINKLDLQKKEYSTSIISDKLYNLYAEAKKND